MVVDSGTRGSAGEPGRRFALMHSARKLVLGSLVALLVLVGLLSGKPWPSNQAPAAVPLVVYCAAGIKAPVEAVARTYEALYGVPVQLQFGGSGALVSNFKVARRGDLFIAADDFFLGLARSNHLVAESIPLAQLTPVLAVRKDRPIKPRSGRSR